MRKWECLEKVQRPKGLMGKIYYAVIRESFLWSHQTRLKSPGNPRNGNRLFPSSSLLMTSCLHRAQQSRTTKPRVAPVRRFVPSLWGWVAPVHLREAGTRCWGLFEQLWREQFLPPSWTAEQTKNIGRLGRFTQPPHSAFATHSADFPKGLRPAKRTRRRAIQRFDFCAG